MILKEKIYFTIYSLKNALSNCLLVLLKVCVLYCICAHLPVGPCFWSSLKVRLHSSSWPRSESEFLSPRWPLRGQRKERLRGGVRSGVVVDDLPGSAVARHSSLRCSCICAHLQADDVFAFGQLFVWEVSSVLLGLPAHTKHTHISQSTVSFLSAEMKPSFVWATFHRVTSSNLLVEPVGVSFVAPIALCHSQATQSHQGPLDSSQVLAWRHATISHEWSPHQI